MFGHDDDDDDDDHMMFFFFFYPTAFFVALVLYLGVASVGHRFLIHRLYVDKLVKLFEYGEKRIRKVNQRIEQNRQSKRKLSLIQEGIDVSKLTLPSETSDSETDSAYSEETALEESGDGK